MPRIKKLNMQEVSGVDYPAHLSNGFSIVKSANPNNTIAFLKAVGRETQMTEKVTKSLADATPEEIAEIAKGLTAEQLQPIVDAINSVVDAEEAGEGEEEHTGTVEDLFASIDLPDNATSEQIAKAFEKAPAIGTILKAMNDRVEKAETASAVEKALRLDAVAIQKSKEDYSHLAFDHDTVAPALRKFRDADPTNGAVLDSLLKALEGQAESALLFKELGTTGGGSETDAYAKITARADELVKAGTVTNKAQGISKALEEQPSLYADYIKEAK